MLLAQQPILVGDLDPQAQRKNSFGLQTPPQIPQGLYYTVITAEAKSDGGATFTSNSIQMSFKVKSKGLALVKPAQAAEPEVKTGNVLGSVDTEPCSLKKDYLPYALVVGMMLLLYVEMRKRIRLEKELKEALKKFPQKGK